MHYEFIVVSYCISQPIKPFDQHLCGRVYLLGGGGGREGLICRSKKATEKTDIMRQNENLYLKT